MGVAGAASLLVAGWLLHLAADELIELRAYEAEVADMVFVGGDRESEGRRREGWLLLGSGFACFLGGLGLLLCLRRSARRTSGQERPEDSTPA